MTPCSPLLSILVLYLQLRLWWQRRRLQHAQLCHCLNNVRSRHARVIVTADGVLQRTACVKATRKSAHQHALRGTGWWLCVFSLYLTRLASSASLTTPAASSVAARNSSRPTEISCFLQEGF